MLKKTITYEDYNGNRITEDFYFHMSEAELTELSVKLTGGVVTVARKIATSTSASEVLEIVKDIIKKSYGIVSENSKRFIKSEDLTSEFMQTPAYSALYMELLEEDNLSNFLSGIMPSNLSKKIDKENLNRQLKDRSGTIRLDSEYDVTKEWGSSE